MTANPETDGQGGALRLITEGLWETTTPVRFVGVSMPARTVIVELGSGGLVVHSPGKLDDATREAVDALGPVRGLIAPNRFHHLFVADWRDAYPDAAVYAAPTLPDKVSKLADAERLSESPPGLWADDMDQHVWQGIPTIGEVVFVHKPSRTLLNGDMMHNMQTVNGWFSRQAWRMLGSYQRFGPSKLEKWLAKDKPALEQSIEHILGWDFDRVTVAHGDVLETGGKDQVRDGWDRILS